MSVNRLSGFHDDSELPAKRGELKRSGSLKFSEQRF